MAADELIRMEHFSEGERVMRNLLQRDPARWAEGVEPVLRFLDEVRAIRLKVESE
jgi:hypothetical protein